MNLFHKNGKRNRTFCFLRWSNLRQNTSNTSNRDNIGSYSKSGVLKKLLGYATIENIFWFQKAEIYTKLFLRIHFLLAWSHQSHARCNRRVSRHLRRSQVSKATYWVILCLTYQELTLKYMSPWTSQNLWPGWVDLANEVLCMPLSGYVLLWIRSSQKTDRSKWDSFQSCTVHYWKLTEFCFTRVQISNADLVLKNGDKEQALAILRQITPEQRYAFSANICWVPGALSGNGTI